MLSARSPVWAARGAVPRNFPYMVKTFGAERKVWRHKQTNDNGWRRSGSLTPNGSARSRTRRVVWRGTFHQLRRARKNRKNFSKILKFYKKIEEHLKKTSWKFNQNPAVGNILFLMKRDQCDFRGKVVLLRGGSSKIRQELHSCQCLGEGRGHVQILNKIFQHSGRKLCQNRSIWANYPVRGEINSSRLAGASLAGIGDDTAV